MSTSHFNLVSNLDISISIWGIDHRIFVASCAHWKCAHKQMRLSPIERVTTQNRLAVLNIFIRNMEKKRY